MPIERIARIAGHSRKLVCNVLRGLTGDIFPVRQSSLDAYLPQLDATWVAGCHNGAELWRRLRVSLKVSLGKVPSARIISPLMTTGRDRLTKADAVIVATIEAEVPTLDEAWSLLSRFQTMIRERRRPDLDVWIETAARSLLAPFASGLLKDKAAVTAALTQSWSNGQTAGQITRLNLVKRQMFGRTKLDLLEGQLIGTPQVRDGASTKPFRACRKLAGRDRQRRRGFLWAERQ